MHPEEVALQPVNVRKFRFNALGAQTQERSQTLPQTSSRIRTDSWSNANVLNTASRRGTHRPLCCRRQAASTRLVDAENKSQGRSQLVPGSLTPGTSHKGVANKSMTANLVVFRFYKKTNLITPIVFMQGLGTRRVEGVFGRGPTSNGWMVNNAFRNKAQR